MKLRWKSAGMLLTLTLSISLLASCSGSNNGGNASNGAANATKQPVSSSDTNEPAEMQAFTKYDPVVEVTTAIALRESDKLLNGDTPDDNPISRWAEETIGIKTKYKWLLTDQGDALNQKIRLAMASGEELPDVLYISDFVVLNELMESGMIEPIDKAFDQFATDRMKAIFEQESSVWNIVSKDGQRMGLPQVSGGPSIVGDPIMWVRQDWLDAVGAKAPTNLQEFEAVLAAFKKKYPDKIPLSYSGKNNLSSWMADMSFLFGSDQPFQWNLDENGKLQYGTVQPTVKQALQTLNNWYKAGYIDPEFGTYDEQMAASQFTSGESGIIFGPGWMGGWPLSDTMKNVSGAKVAPYPVPAGIDGKLGHKGSKSTYGAYVFRKGFDKWEGIFTYYDASLSRTIMDEGSPFLNGYAEGYDYRMIDGKPVWKDAPASKANLDTQRYLMINAGSLSAGIDENGKSVFERIMEGSIDSVYEQQLAETSVGTMYIEGMAASAKQAGSAYPERFMSAPTPTMAEKWTLLGKTEAETLLKIVYGKANIDEFDKFVADWKAKGGDAITKEVNDWYESIGGDSR